MKQKTILLVALAAVGLVCTGIAISSTLRRNSQKGSMLDGAQWARLKFSDGELKSKFSHADRPILNQVNEVSLPGYMIPLEGSAANQKQFVLIPYLPSCVHLPPPLGDQRVLVTLPSSAPLRFNDSPVVVRGSLQRLPEERLGCAYELKARGLRPWSHGQFFPSEED